MESEKTKFAAVDTEGARSCHALVSPYYPTKMGNHHISEHENLICTSSKRLNSSRRQLCSELDPTLMLVLRYYRTVCGVFTKIWCTTLI